VAKPVTTSFRFDERFHELLEQIASLHGLSKTEVVIQSTLVLDALFREAEQNVLADMAALCERYGDDAELLCMADVGADGLPVGRVVIDKKLVDDVLVRPFVDKQTGIAHMYLDVDRTRGEAPNHVPFGAQWLFIPNPRIAIGRLPWPPRRDKEKGIRIRLGDLADLIPEQLKASAV